MSTQDQATPELETQAPPVSPSLMEEVAASRGVVVDVVDAGGREGVFEPEPLRERGPLANSLDGRLTGSAAAVDQDGAAAGGGQADPTLATRVSGPEEGPS